MIKELPAFDLAARWHTDQVRKGCKHEPFVHHPFRVATILIHHGVHDPDIISAALLHDILEDSLCPREEIVQIANHQVLLWVLELTDRKEILKSERKQMQVERAGYLSPEAKLIRLADKTDNVRSLCEDPPRGWSYQRQREYVAWANRVVKALGPIHPALETDYWDTSKQVWMNITGQASQYM